MFSKIDEIEILEAALESEAEEQCEFESRYAPMKALLSDADIQFLRASGAHRQATRLRTEHRKIFLGYMDALGEEVRALQSVRRGQIARGAIDQVYSYHHDAALFVYHFARLRAAAWMHQMSLECAAAMAQRSLSQLAALVTARHTTPASAS